MYFWKECLKNNIFQEKGEKLVSEEKKTCKKKCDCKEKEKEVQKEESNDKSTKELENVKSELSKTKEMFLRTAAEYDNFRKRSEKEKESIYSDALCFTIMNILPLADSIDAAVKSAENFGEEYKKGIELLKEQLNKSFENLNVESFGNIGEDFDPNIHNAISHKESDDEKQNFISEVFQKGYKINQKVIRHAMVEVTN